MIPRDVNGLDLAFPTTVDGFLPPYADIPEEFKNWNGHWSSIASHWFFKGMKGATFVPKKGIDQSKALCHLQYCLGSWEPKHEHKIAGVAYLMSQWFEKIEVPSDG